MTSKTKNSPDNPDQNTRKNSGRNRTAAKTTRSRRTYKTFSSGQKVQAVLAVWTERLSQMEICRQLQINYATFQKWQNRAMEGMLQALDNQLQINDTAVLSPHLRKLMDRGRGLPEDRLGRRLIKIQQERDNSPPI